MQYQGISGMVYFIEDSKIASGGEGTIHAIQNNNKQVVKIFKPEKRSLEREEKLCHMVKTKLSPGELAQVTWPQDVIYDQNGFAGYIMPKLMGAESLTTIYSNGTNNKYDLRYRVHIAINLCHAIKTVHDMGQVCGDLNPQNICVNLDINDKANLFHVILVDTDSYHITAEGTTYRCEVGLADYIAPELQNKMMGLSLRDAPLPTYTKETDLFALAVHIFALLMNGCHPFACAKDVNGTLENTMEQMVSSNIGDSVVAPQPIENIKDGYFPFYEWKIGITPPIYAPSFEALSPDLQMLFVRSFVDGYKDPSKRVDTQEWIDALMIERTKVVSCPRMPKHHYFEHYGKCPLCEVDERIGKMFDPPPPPEPSSSQEPFVPPEPEPVLKRKWKPVWGTLLLFIIVEGALRYFKSMHSVIITEELITAYIWLRVISMVIINKKWSGIFLVVSGLISALGMFLSFFSSDFDVDNIFHSYLNVFVIDIWLGIILIVTSKKTTEGMRKTWWLPGIFAFIIFYLTCMERARWPYIMDSFGIILGTIGLVDIFIICVLVIDYFMVAYWATHTYKEININNSSVRYYAQMLKK